MTSPLGPLAADPERAGILLDFDGTLSPIVGRPEDAGPAPEARETLEALVRRYRLVAVISGRPADDLARRVGVDGVQYEGLYGLTVDDRAADPLLAHVEAVTGSVPGAWVEAKGVTVAVHYRQAQDPDAARSRLAPALGSLAEEAGYDLLEGKMVFELVPAGESRKGGAVARLVRETDLTAALYAGDDLPDLEAFSALDDLAAGGLRTVKIAVGGPELSPDLAAAADAVVEGPRELIELLREELL